MVNSLLTAIVRADGDALVMHVGEKPYVVAATGPVELSSRPLTFEAVSGMLGQLLPADHRRALDELGAIEHDLPRSPVAGGERFTVVAARGGNDIWIEIRRHRAVPFEIRKPIAEAAPAAQFAPVTAPEPAAAQVPAPEVPSAPVAAPPAATSRPEPAPQSPVLPSPSLGGFAASRPARPVAVPSSPVAEEPRAPGAAEPVPAVIVPLARSPIRSDAARPRST